MHETVGAAALAAELLDSTDVLRALQHRVQREGETRPRIELGAWSGSASWACRAALAALDRQIAVTTELLRCAADLTAAAAEEVRARA
jgi:hypothetical protein